MICQNCIHSEVCKHKTEAVYECEHFKDGTIKNQYDRIRNMSIEEMAELIVEISGQSIKRNIFGRFVKDVTLINAYKGWLESEVTE